MDAHRPAGPFVARLAIPVGAWAIVLVAATLPGRTGAAESLTNRDFESWGPGGPDGWSLSAPATQVAGFSGLGAAVSSSTEFSQTVPAAPGVAVDASITARADAAGTLTLRLRFLDSGLAPIQPDVAKVDDPLSAAWKAVSLQTTAPAGAAYVRFIARADPSSGATITVDDASLDLGTAPTATPTPTPATPSPSATPASTPAATSTPSPTGTPLPANTPTSIATPSATAAPAIATPTSASSPSPPPPAGGPQFGGLLRNGNFETVEGGKPSGWAKFGGDLSATPDAYRGAFAAALSSETSSAKWVYQAVPVTGESWYEANAYARLAAGAGDVFLRVSWYASSDGSGNALSSDDSTGSAGADWTPLATGALQAPAAAHSARVRLMLRPDGPATAMFDDVSFVPTAAPPPGEPVAKPSATPGGAVTGIPGATDPVPRPSTTPRPTSNRPGATTGPLTLRLSEFLADPAEPGRDGPFEWIELVNIGQAPVALGGWQLGDSSSVDTLDDVTVPPGGYVVVAARAAVLPDGIAVVRVRDGELGSALNNNGDTIVLLAPNGSEVDVLSFGDDTTVFDPAPAAAPAGSTLGVRDPAADSGNGNWSVTLSPSPGRPNTFPAGAGPTRTAQSGAAPGSPAREPARIIESGNGQVPAVVVLAVAAGLAAAGAAALGGRYWREHRRNRHAA